MSTILYSTDYSKNSVAALKYAFGLVGYFSGKLVICHIYDIPTVFNTEGLNETFPNLEEKAFAMQRAKLEDFCEKHLGKKWQTPNVSTEIMQNISVTHGIISIANKCYADLVVVGMKGSSKIKELLMGSTTKQLVKKSPCPVLAIPAETSFMPFQTIVYATDFEEEDIHAIQKLVELIKPFSATLHVVHISTKKEYAGDVQMEWFKELLHQKVSYSPIEFELMLSKDIFESLRIYLGKIGADVLVMLERDSKGLLKNLFHEDLVKKMESYGKLPILSYRESNILPLNI